MRDNNVITLPTYGLGSGASNYSGNATYNPSKVLWEWNRTDMSQFGSPVDINGGIALGVNYGYALSQARTSAGTLVGPMLPSIRWTHEFAGVTTYKGFFLPIPGLKLPNTFSCRIMMDRPGGSTSIARGVCIAWQDTSHFLMLGHCIGASTHVLGGHNNTAATASVVALSGTGNMPSFSPGTVGSDSCCAFYINWANSSPVAGDGFGLAYPAKYNTSVAGSNTYSDIPLTGANGWSPPSCSPGLILYHEAAAAKSFAYSSIFHIGFYTHSF